MAYLNWIDLLQRFAKRDRFMWPGWRWIPFICFLVSGVGASIFFVWHPGHFNAECADSGNRMPGYDLIALLLTNGVWIIPAVTTIAFSQNTYYRVTCLVICAVQSFLVYSIVWEQMPYENCYRDIGASEMVIFLVEALGGAAIVLLTIAVGFAIRVPKAIRRLSRGGP